MLLNTNLDPSLLMLSQSSRNDLLNKLFQILGGGNVSLFNKVVSNLAGRDITATMDQLDRTSNEDVNKKKPTTTEEGGWQNDMLNILGPALTTAIVLQPLLGNPSIMKGLIRASYNVGAASKSFISASINRVARLRSSAPVRSSTLAVNEENESPRLAWNVDKGMNEQLNAALIDGALKDGEKDFLKSLRNDDMIASGIGAGITGVVCVLAIGSEVSL